MSNYLTKEVERTGSVKGRREAYPYLPEPWPPAGKHETQSVALPIIHRHSYYAHNNRGIAQLRQHEDLFATIELIPSIHSTKNRNGVRLILNEALSVAGARDKGCTGA